MYELGIGHLFDERKRQMFSSKLPKSRLWCVKEYRAVKEFGSQSEKYIPLFLTLFKPFVKREKLFVGVFRCAYFYMASQAICIHAGIWSALKTQPSKVRTAAEQSCRC